MLLPELKQLAQQLGITGASGMRKGDLVAAIGERQRPLALAGRLGTPSAPPRGPAASRPPPRRPSAQPRPQPASRRRRRRRRASDRARPRQRRAHRAGRPPATRAATAIGRTATARTRAADRDRQDATAATRAATATVRIATDQRPGRQPRATVPTSNRDDQGDDRGSRRRRGRDRFRDRKDRQRGGASYNDAELEISEDDVLVPVAGILDVSTTTRSSAPRGYLPGPQRRLRLAVDGPQARPAQGRRRHRRDQGAARRAERKEKFNPLVRLDTVNGGPLEAARNRPEFSKLTPLYPQERLRLETDAEQPDHPGHRPGRADRQGPARPDRLAAQGRQDDGAAGDRQRDHHEQPRVPPDGRARRRAARGGHRHAALGQGRGHRLDLRPAGRGPHDVAELAIERAKRLVELGHDVVVLLDSITRLGRAYNLAAPASGPHPVRRRRLDARSTRRSGSSARPATSRTAAR